MSVREEQIRERCVSGSAIHLTMKKSLLKYGRACLALQLSPLPPPKKSRSLGSWFLISSPLYVYALIRLDLGMIRYIFFEALITRALRKVLIRYLNNWSGTPRKSAGV